MQSGKTRPFGAAPYGSVPDLVGHIKRYTEHYNLTARPFVWTATADSIIAKLERLCKLINGAPH